MITQACRRLILAVVLTLALSAAASHAAGLLEGTWGGAYAAGETAQVIVTGGQVIGFYWRGNYAEAGAAKISENGARIDFTFAHGSANLRQAASGATPTIKENGRGRTQINLKKD